ncbi:hypothetical protein ACIF8T_21300 [Streptomyces sp. NPDC085946]|uniref:hypothetical protein n=1 Tax=Streptomyces sp. NPDC085946 TaxID=3365744 RepID=UPI0037D2F882
MHPDRYHLTLSSDGRPVAQGWWASEATARGKFTEWVGDWGKPGVQVTLIDEDTGETLTEWPEES